MRPPVSDLPAFARKPSFDRPSPSPSQDPRTAVPATFFLSRSPHASDPESPPFPPDDAESSRESMYGVHSLDETLSQVGLVGSPRSSPRDPPAEYKGDHQQQEAVEDDLDESLISRRRQTIKPVDSGLRESPLRPLGSDAASRPLTPLNLGNPDEPSSLPSSPKSVSNQSLRPLDDISITDETNSQVITSGDEDEGPRLRASPRPTPGVSQLIMPSIRMPSRRPFTGRGKDMGRFKVLLAGAPGMHCPPRYFWFSCSNVLRLGENFFNQIDCSGLRGHCTCRFTSRDYFPAASPAVASSFWKRTRSGNANHHH